MRFRLSPHAFTTFWGLHAWAGVLLGLLLFLIFATGSITLFREQLSIWEEPLAQRAVPDGLLDADVQRALRGAQGAPEIWFFLPKGSGAPRFSFPSPEGWKTYWIDSGRDSLVAEREHLSSFLYSLHFFWHAATGLFPYYAAGVLALGLLVILASGVLIHAKDLVREFQQFRPGKSGRVLCSDLHKRLATMSLPFQVMYAYTGAMLVLAPVVLRVLPSFSGATARAADVWSGERAAVVEPGPASKVLAFDELLSRARATVPSVSWETIRVVHHGRANGIFEVTGTTQRAPQHQVRVRLREVDGRVLATHGLHQESPAAELRRWATILHFARFGGVATRAAFFALGLATCVTILTGNWLWIGRREARQASAHNRILARATVGVGAGTAVSTAVLFMVSRLLPLEWTLRGEAEELSFIASLAACLTWSLVARDEARLWWQGLALAGGLLLAVPALAARWSSFGLLGSGPRLWPVLGVDIGLLAIGTLLLGVALCLRRRLRRGGAAMSVALLAAAPARALEPSAHGAVRDEPGTEVGGAPLQTSGVNAEIELPVVITTSEPVYPDEALRERLEATVILRITVDVAGSVTDVDVVAPAGHGFDEAARVAAVGARFSPARRGSRPVAARVLFPVVFRLPARGDLAPVAATEAAAPTAATASNEARRSAPQGKDAGPGPHSVREVVVEGDSVLERRQASAEAVKVIDTAEARRRATDLTTLLARSPGVGARRSGGLGSVARFSLNGLTDDQIRFFLDGVPLELAGYPFGLANVPLAQLERIEIYSGVVPVRFGADALGGAVNLLSDERSVGTRVAGSYETGAFGTYRGAVSARHSTKDGLFARVNGSIDWAKNDYRVRVVVPDERGRPSPLDVYRFHDAYRALGAVAEAGVFGRPYAKRLSLRGFVSDYRKEYQHNLVMTVPYGAVTHGSRTAGVSLSYEKVLGRDVALDAIAGYATTRSTFTDVATCVYDWIGRCVRSRPQGGETDDRPHDRLYREGTGFARLNLSWQPRPEHVLRVAVAPTYARRVGDERRQSDVVARDPLAAPRELLSLVTGLEYQLTALVARLQSVMFIKHYAHAVEQASLSATVPRIDRTSHRVGIGEGARYRFNDWLYAKASYELATRLPRIDEVFGDNAFIVANPALEPERGHNLNLSVNVRSLGTSLGAMRASVTGFLRQLDHLIVLLGDDRVQHYDNVLDARSLGAEVAVGWSDPKTIFGVDANLTYQDYRNVSRQGTFATFYGDRIPNRPYFFANLAGRCRLQDALTRGDELTIAFDSAYVHSYFRGWESVGLREFKQTIPAQLVHSVGLSYVLRRGRALFSSSLELQNVTDAKVFDVFGVQRPGRGLYTKTTVEF